MYWALEIGGDGSSPQGFSRMINRLRVITYEDIGLGDDISSILIALMDLEKKSSEWKLTLSYIILKMCRAKKSRITDDFLHTVEIMRKGYNKPEIPDYALDIHTTKGRKLGRGSAHFRNIGSKLKNENRKIDNIYKI